MDLHFGPLLICATVIRFLFFNENEKICVHFFDNKWPTSVSWNISAIIEADK
jgi:hypothetical protein